MLDRFTGYKRLLALAALNGGGASIIERTAIGNPLTFITDLARPLKSLLIPFTPQQSGTGDPSPQNIRSILPWNGLTVFGGGKNLLNPVADDWLIRENTYRYINGVVPEGATARFTLEVKDSTVDISGCYLGFVLNDLAESSPTGYKWVIEGGTVKSDMSNLSTGGSQVGQRCSNVFIYPATAEVFQKLFSRFNVMVELGQTESAYEQYKPITETSISFASPVYGGELEAVSGKLMDAFNFVDLGSKSWKLRSENQSRQVWECVCNDAKFGREGNTYTANAISSEFSLTTSSAAWSVGKFAPALSSNDKVFIFSVPAGSYANATECKEAMDGIQLCYELIDSAKQEIQLTPAQITALVGDNTIWSDADGSMAAVFYKKG